MAPREATGTFPDQYLTFDYDAANMGMQMPPHDPFPVQTALDVAQNDLENTAGGGGVQENNNTNLAAAGLNLNSAVSDGTGLQNITNSQQQQAATFCDIAPGPHVPFPDVLHDCQNCQICKLLSC